MRGVRSPTRAAARRRAGRGSVEAIRRHGASWAVLGIGALTVIAYVPSFHVPFQFDDYARIVDNAKLREGTGVLESLAWLGSSRVVPALSLALNYALGRDDTFGYHVGNLLVHLLASLGVFELALALCRTPRLRGSSLAERPLPVAAAAALLFACHPLQTQAVTYVIQRFAAMATSFYVWAVVLYVQARNRSLQEGGTGARSRYAGALLLALCAVLSKENTVSLPAAVLLTEWIFFGSRLRWRTLASFAAAGALVVAIPLLWRVLAWRPIGAAARSSWLGAAKQSILAQGVRPSQVASPVEYWLTQLTVLPRYLGLLFWPPALNIDHDVPTATGMARDVAGGLALLAALLALGLRQAKRRPLIGFGILWFFVALSVESLLPLGDVMMEHRMYLAMPGVSMVFAGLFGRAVARRPSLSLSVAAPLVVLLVLLTFQRNQVWRTPLSLWSDAARKSPGKARVHVNLGVAYHGLHRLDEAIREYCRALELDPATGLARDNLEIALEDAGRLDEAPGKVVGDGQKAGGPPGSVIIELDLQKACP
jgi:hypothetical protein